MFTPPAGCSLVASSKVPRVAMSLVRSGLSCASFGFEHVARCSVSVTSGREPMGCVTPGVVPAEYTSACFRAVRGSLLALKGRGITRVTSTTVTRSI